MDDIAVAAAHEAGAEKKKAFNRKALIAAVIKKTGLPGPKALAAIDAVFESIRGSLEEGNEVRVPKFGLFSLKDRKAGKNAASDSAAEIGAPAKKMVRFRAGKGLRNQIAK